MNDGTGAEILLHLGLGLEGVRPVGFAVTAKNKHQCTHSQHVASHFSHKVVVLEARSKDSRSCTVFKERREIDNMEQDVL